MFFLLACAAAPAAPSAPADMTAAPASAAASAPALASAFVDGLPHVRQRPDFCGEACLAMAMAGRGLPVHQDAVFDLTGLDPALGRGAYARELVVAARALGFDPGPTWQRVAPGDTAALDRAFAALVADLAAGWPSIVCTHFDERPDTTEHFRLITGYDATTDEIRYHDPALDQGADLRMSRARLLTLWPLHGADTDALIRLRLKPVATPTLAPATGAADRAQAVMARGR